MMERTQDFKSTIKCTYQGREIFPGQVELVNVPERCGSTCMAPSFTPHSPCHSLTRQEPTYPTTLSDARARAARLLGILPRACATVTEPHFEMRANLSPSREMMLMGTTLRHTLKDN